MLRSLRGDREQFQREVERAVFRLARLCVLRVPFSSNVVYNLNREPSPTLVPMYIVKGGHNFHVGGTATETLTPLDASGNPISSATVWVSNDSIQCQVIASPTAAVNSYRFSTDTTISQSLSPATATTPSWSGTTSTYATGSVGSTLTAGTLSLNEQITQTLAAVGNAAVVGPAWTINATFGGSGTFQETQPTTTADMMPSGSLVVSGTLTGSVLPPNGSLLPTQKLSSQVSAAVEFYAT